jgi:hypothetical protein
MWNNFITKYEKLYSGLLGLKVIIVDKMWGKHDTMFTSTRLDTEDSIVSSVFINKFIGEDSQRKRKPFRY